MGDIIDWNEQKMFAKANAHGAVVAKNIIAQVNGSNPTVQYKGFMEWIVLTVGPVRESLLLTLLNVSQDFHLLFVLPDRGSSLFALALGNHARRLGVEITQGRKPPRSHGTPMDR